MKIAHQVSLPMVGTLTADTSVQTVNYEGLTNSLYREIYSSKVNDGTYLIQMPDGCGSKHVADKFIRAGVDFGVNEIMISCEALDWSTALDYAGFKLAESCGVRICPVVVNAGGYEDAVKVKGIESVGLRLSQMRDDNEPGGWSRFQMIHELVKTGKFRPHLRHRLVGMLNPAEIVAYRRAFSDFIYGSIDIAITNLCFEYSLYGVHLSRDNGVYHKLVIFPGTDEMNESAYRTEQETLYYLNREIMDEFARGIGGDRFMRTYDQQGVDVSAGIGIALAKVSI